MRSKKGSADRSLNGHDLHLRRERVDRAGDPGHQPATAKRHDHHGEVVNVLDKLETDRALAGHDRRIVKGMNEVQTGRQGASLGQDNAVVERVAFEMYRGAVADRRVGLGDRRLRRHVHLARHARRTCRESGCLGVIAGRGDNYAGPGPLAKSSELRRRPADLEGAGSLEVLGLKDDA